MSDTYLRIIPADPTCVPSALARERALDVIRRALPVNGHWILPRGGHEMSPVAASRPAR